MDSGDKVQHYPALAGHYLCTPHRHMRSTELRPASRPKAPRFLMLLPPAIRHSRLVNHNAGSQNQERRTLSSAENSAQQDWRCCPQRWWATGSWRNQMLYAGQGRAHRITACRARPTKRQFERAKTPPNTRLGHRPMVHPAQRKVTDGGIDKWQNRVSSSS